MPFLNVRVVRNLIKGRRSQCEDFRRKVAKVKAGRWGQVAHGRGTTRKQMLLKHDKQGGLYVEHLKRYWPKLGNNFEGCDRRISPSTINPRLHQVIFAALFQAATWGQNGGLDIVVAGHVFRKHSVWTSLGEDWAI